ncbi:MAG: hypothetical protein A2X46_12880 [Lentisphaerae bacterium GWF2_57_35]|nr:MAG: hypothetical protein A2X46_12880 [Lentisphaerae bacterium GWF2_57_35]
MLSLAAATRTEKTTGLRRRLRSRVRKDMLGWNMLPRCPLSFLLFFADAYEDLADGLSRGIALRR